MPRNLIYWCLGILLSSVVIFPAMPMIYLDLQVQLHRSNMQRLNLQCSNPEVFVVPYSLLKTYLIDDQEMVYKHNRYDIIDMSQIGGDLFEIRAVLDSYEALLLARISDLHGSKKNEDSRVLQLIQPDWTSTSLPQLHVKPRYEYAVLTPQTDNIHSSLSENCWYPPPD